MATLIRPTGAISRRLLDADSLRYERQVFLLRKHLVRTVFALNELMTIGHSIAGYEAAYDIGQRKHRKQKPEMEEMARRYGALIEILRAAEQHLQTGV